MDIKESERMNYRRHLEKAQAEATKPVPAPAPVTEPSPDPEPEISEIQTAAETGLEVITENDEPEVTFEEPIETELIVAEAVEEAADEVAGIVEEIIPAAEPEKPELNMSMKKEELLEAARERGVQISARATKAAIIEAIEKAQEADTDK